MSSVLRTFVDNQGKPLCYHRGEYSKSIPTKYHRHDTVTRNKFNRQKGKNDIVNHAVDEIIPQVRKILSAEAEAHKNIEYDINENYLYQIYSMSINEEKEKIG